MINNPSENKNPKTAAKGLIIGLSSLLVICLIPTIISLSINQTLFATDFYAEVLKKSNFYDQVPVLLSDAIMKSGTSFLPGGLLTELDQEQFRWLMTSLLPPGWIEAETNSAMSSVLDFMNFKTDSLRIIVDLQPVKNYLLSFECKQSLVNLLNNLPDCSDDQLTQIMIAMQSGQGGFALCHPPASDLFNMNTILEPVVNSFSNSLPAAILIPPADQVGTMDSLVKSPVFQIYRTARSVLYFFPWLCLILTLMIIILSLRSLHWMSGALGGPLVIASIMTSIPGVWLYLSGGRDLSGLFANASLGSFQGFEGLLVEVFQKGLQTAGQGLLIWCLGALTIGLILLMIWFITRR
jgi:hypothetical protein